MLYKEYFYLLLQDQIEELEENVARLERMTRLDGTGTQLEYLKNVVLNYMLSTDLASRDHMLKAGLDHHLHMLNYPRAVDF